LIDCLIQRDIGYNIQDVREAYEKIKVALLDETLTKVVVIAHSQGGIVISMALDNLLADLPRECASHHRMEIDVQVSRGWKSTPSVVLRITSTIPDWHIK
jgi:hypothetical protein